MTRQEVAKLIKSAAFTWPTMRLPEDPEELALMVDAWMRRLGDHDYEDAAKALDRFTGKWAPGVTEIVDALDTSNGYEEPWMNRSNGRGQTGSFFHPEVKGCPTCGAQHKLACTCEGPLTVKKPWRCRCGDTGCEPGKCFNVPA